MESKDGNLKHYPVVFPNGIWICEARCKICNPDEHPSGGLVALDEEELRKFISEQPECGEHYIDVDLGYEGDLVDEICKRFAQREIKYPPNKEWNDDRAMTINPSSDNYKMGWNHAIKEFKKLNEERK